MTTEDPNRAAANRAALRVPLIRRAPEPAAEQLSDGIGLCLSGGGFRAMLFHLGTLLRLNEAGLLAQLRRVSSVSGGSISAAMLATRWRALDFAQDGAGRMVAGRLEPEVIAPLRKLASRAIATDVRAVLGGLFIPGLNINRVLAGTYKTLFDKQTLADLPDLPEFVFDATNLQSGDLWRFTKTAEGDSRVGSRAAPDTQLATVVAASSAFPPVLSPARLSYPSGALSGGLDAEVSKPPFTTKPILADGGVYDNLGLEAVWTTCRTVLISDAGGHMKDAPRPRAFWPLQFARVLQVIDNQVRDLRKHEAVLGFERQDRQGSYWGIRSHVPDFPVSPVIASPSPDEVKALAGVPTRLSRIASDLQERLINWGYVICDTALRAHVDQTLAPGRQPYPASPVG